MSYVVFKKIGPEGDPRRVIPAVTREAMRLAGWRKYIKKRRVFVKGNFISPQLIPGQNTNPFVVAGVVQELTEAGFDVAVGDASLTASSTTIVKSKVVWGYEQVAQKYNAEFINLSEAECIEHDLREIKTKIKCGNMTKAGRKVLDSLDSLLFPRFLLDADIVTVPVIKSHPYTTLTCCLKNSWGCIPRVLRSHLHPAVGQVITIVNKILAPRFAVVDGTIGMNGKGPRTGRPKICNVIMAGHDIVAVDSLVASYMGFSPDQVEHIVLADINGVGSSQTFQLLGDEFEKASAPFLTEENFAMLLERKLRDTPLQGMLFQSPLFAVLCALSNFNSSYLYPITKGYRYLNDIVSKSWYGRIFEELKQGQVGL